MENSKSLLTSKITFKIDSLKVSGTGGVGSNWKIKIDTLNGQLPKSIETTLSKGDKKLGLEWGLSIYPGIK